MQQAEKAHQGSPIPWWSRIRFRVLVFGVLLSTIPVILVSSYYLYFAKRDLQRSIQVQNNLLVERMVQEVDALLFHTEESLKNLPLAIPAEGEANVLYRFLQEFPMVDEVVLLDANGAIRYGVNRFRIFEPNNSDWKSLDFLPTLRSGKVYYSTVSFLASGIPSVKIVVPYFSADRQNFQGGIGAQVRLRSLLKMVRSNQVNQKTDMFLVDNSGTLIAHSDLTRVLERTDVRRSYAVQHFLQIGDPSELPAPNEYLSYSGQKVLGVYARLPRTGWAVVVEQPVAVAFATINVLLKQLILFLLVMLGGAIFFSIYFGLSFTRPIEFLERAVREVGKGDLHKKITSDRTDELGQLAKAFNDMLEKLRQQADNLLQEKERLNTIVNGIGAGLALIYPDHRVAWMNPVLEKWIKDGVPRSENENPLCFQMLGDCGNADCRFGKTLDKYTEKDSEDIITYLNRGGKQKVLRHRVYRLEHVHPGEPSLLIVVEDITEQRRMEEMVMQTDKLSALGLMASGFAHEINNPLATIQGYAEDLEDRLQAEDTALTDSGVVKRYLRIIRKNIDRAQRITQSLLNFSRKSAWKQELVDVQAVLEESLSLINHAFVKKGVHLIRNWEVPLPKVKGDAMQLMQVFINLLNNALDAVQEGGEIRIRGKTEKDNLILNFIDNGEGIPSEHLPLVFDPFFTTKEIGKGTGLGLSVSYGIIARMGGSIRIESEKGRGTEVILTFPLQGEAAATLVEKS